MRSFAIVGGLCLIAALACSNTKTPPVGRWEGVVEAPDAMAAARLEISPKGDIYLGAVNTTEIENVPDAEKAAMRKRLAEELASDWRGIRPRPLEFDGLVFRKPGGVASQIEWNPQTKQMTAILYLGTRAALRVPMHQVLDFSDDPWWN